MAIDFILFCSNSYYLLLNSSSWTVNYIYYILWLALFRWWVEEVNDTSSLLRGSVHLQLHTSRSSWFKVVKHWSLTSAIRRSSECRRQSFVVLLAVARRNWSMRHLWSITGRCIHLQRNWLYSCVATVDCDCSSDCLFSSLP